MDLLVVKIKLVFPTSPNVWLESLEHGDDFEMLYKVASATNRAQVDFCSNDKKATASNLYPLADIEKSIEIANQKFH